MIQPHNSESIDLQLAQSPHDIMENVMPGQETAQTEEKTDAKHTFKELKFAYTHFVNSLDQLVGKIPDWVPLLGSLLEGKIKLIKSSIALALGIDPENPNQPFQNWNERLQTAGGYLTESLLKDLQSLYEVLLLVGSGGGSIGAEAAAGGAGAQATLKFTEVLGKLSTTEGAGALVDLLPDALRKIIPAIDATAQPHLDEAVQALQRMVNNPQFRQAATEQLQAQTWWQDLQRSLAEGKLTVQEVQQKVEQMQAKAQLDSLFNQRTEVTPSANSNPQQP